MTKTFSADWVKLDRPPLPRWAWSRERAYEAGSALPFNRRTPENHTEPDRTQNTPNRTGQTDRGKMREIVHIQAGQCGNQIGAKVRIFHLLKIRFKSA